MSDFELDGILARIEEGKEVPNSIPGAQKINTPNKHNKVPVKLFPGDFTEEHDSFEGEDNLEER